MRLTALCLATTTASAGMALAAPAASAAPVSAELGARAVALAAQEEGDPYVFGAEGPDAFDCSGLVQYVYGRLGVPVPRTSAAQHAAMTPVARADVRPGDVLFFRDAGGRIYHDGIYAGGGRMWAAPQTGKHVRLQPLYSDSWTAGRPSAPASASSALKPGARGPEVAAVQRALGVPADGVFGPGTAAAVARFQASRGLTPDGVVGPRTRKALLGGAPPAAPATPAAPKAGPPAAKPPSPTAPAGRPTLRTGDRGPAVAALQRALGLPADGAFGPRTHAAVVAFQRRAGLVADGVVGGRTWAALGR